MGGALKNLIVTALLVIGATVAGVSLAGVLVLLIDSGGAGVPADPGMAAFGITAVWMMAAVVGVFFCFVTLAVALVTMPPVLGLAHLLRLPRPAIDIIGGAMAGLLCASFGIEMFDHGKLA